MGLKLVKSLLAGAVLLIGMSDAAIARGNGQATDISLPSGKCGRILQSVQDILTKSGQGNTGVVPESLSEMPTNVSVDEEPNNPEGIDYQLTHKVNNKEWGRCFKISGDWFSDKDNNQVIKKDGGNFPRINAYVFFKDLTVETLHENLIVGIVDEDKRFIALTAKAMNDGERTGVFAGAKYMDFSKIDSVSNYISKYKQSIIWLNRTKNLNVDTVVLCEDSCSDILAMFRVNRVANNKPSGTSNLNKGVSETAKSGTKQTNMDTGRNVTSKYSDKNKKGSKTKTDAEHKNESKSECKEVSKCAVDKFMDSKTVFKFIDNRDNKLMELGRKDLITQVCIPPKAEKIPTLKSLSTFFYKNCISISGYKVINAKPTIQSENIPTVTFTLRKNKPEKFSRIEVPVKMADGSSITDACFLRAKIINTGSDKEVFFREDFFTTKSKPKQHTFSLDIKKQISWKGKTLVLEKLEGADCKPEGGGVRIPLTSKVITNRGVLKLQKRLELHSMLGKALLVLNTMIGVKQVNASASTTQFYPIADDEDSRELITEIVARTLHGLRGKVKGLNVGLRQQNGELKFENFTADFENLSAKETAKLIVSSVSFSENEFNWDTMIRTVNQFALKPTEYTYWIFIGQSGLSDDKNYCKNIPSELQPLKQEVMTFIYDFASNENYHSPALKDLTPFQRKFPAISCPVSNSTVEHVVLYPQSIKPGWNENISRLFSNAFKDR